MDQSTSSVNIHTPRETQNKGNPRGEPIRLHLTDKMFIENGEDLDLKISVILQTKTCSNADRLLFCEITNEYPSTTNYETTRLACVVAKNGIILWNHLLFSNAMIFPKSMDPIGDIEIYDNNNILIEKIPARIMKRKLDLNQSDNINRRPPRSRKAQQTQAQTDTQNPQINQGHHTQTTNAPIQTPIQCLISATERRFQGPNPRNEDEQYRNQVEYLVTGRQYQGSNLQNEHLQYQNEVEYPATRELFQGPDFPNENLQYQNEVEYPATREPCQGPNFQNEHLQYRNEVEYPATREPCQGPDFQNEHLQYQNEVEYPATREPFQGPDFQNEHLRYQNQVQYPMPIAGGQYRDPSLINEHARNQDMMSLYLRIENPSNPQYILPPMTTNNRTDEVFLNRSATAAMNSYEMYTRTTFHQLESTIDPMFSDLSHRQEETSSQGFSSLPNIQSFLGQPITNNPRERVLSSNNDEDFTDTDEYD